MSDRLTRGDEIDAIGQTLALLTVSRDTLEKASAIMERAGFSSAIIEKSTETLEWYNRLISNLVYLQNITNTQVDTDESEDENE